MITLKTVNIFSSNLVAQQQIIFKFFAQNIINPKIYMQTYQQSKEISPLTNHTQEYPLVPFGHASQKLHFIDKKTQQLYNNISQLYHTQNGKQDDELMKEAEQQTHLNSHKTYCKPNQLKEMLRSCLLMKRIQLTQLPVQEAKSLQLRDRSYSIIKCRKERKGALREQEFQEMRGREKKEDREIVYAYDNNHGKSQVKSIYTPYKTNESFNKLQQTKLSTPTSSTKRKHKLTLFTAEVKLKTSCKQVSSKESKGYKFKKLKDNFREKRNLKIHYNLFNMCDRICSQEGQDCQQERRNAKLSLLETKIREKLWIKEK